MRYAEKIAVFDEIRITPANPEPNRIKGKISILKNGSRRDFDLIFSYSQPVRADRNMAGLILSMPVINFTLFSKKMVLDFPASTADLDYLAKLVRINNREVFINKLVRRRYEFFLGEFLPDESDISAENADGVTELVCHEVIPDAVKAGMPDAMSVAVMSSGGKESLLTFGMLGETGATTHAFFFNESGGHWLTAKTAYSSFLERYGNVHKVWSNVDRLYQFFLRNLDILDPVVSGKRADTYPVQLFIFPVYVMAFVPLATRLGIGSIVLGDEFDDPREMQNYRGLRHYYGIFDQSGDFNSLMTEYLEAKGIGLRLWSAVYPVTGFTVERILVSRYPELFTLQRSCHSCRSVNGSVVPCGKCSKCLGIMMFVEAAGGDPRVILYSEDSVRNLRMMVDRERMRLDSDELALMKSELGFSQTDPAPLQHVKGIHQLHDEEIPFEKVPDELRKGIISIVEEYTNGTYLPVEGKWEAREGNIRKIRSQS